MTMRAARQTSTPQATTEEQRKKTSKKMANRKRTSKTTGTNPIQYTKGGLPKKPKSRHGLGLCKDKFKDPHYWPRTSKCDFCLTNKQVCSLERPTCTNCMRPRGDRKLGNKCTWKYADQWAVPSGALAVGAVGAEAEVCMVSFSSSLALRVIIRVVFHRRCIVVPEAVEKRGKALSVSSVHQLL
jgi:hypothetical protein